MATNSGIEIGHLIFSHLLQVVLDVTIKSSPLLSSNTFSNAICDWWNRFVNNSVYRPSNCTKTSLNFFGKKHKLKMKETSMYCLFFEFTVHASVFGVQNKYLHIMKRLIKWIGCLFSDTVDKNCINWLQQECINLILDINKIDSLRIAFENKVTLRAFKQFAFFCLKWDDIPSRFFGLKYESSHTKNIVRLNANQNYHKESILVNVTKKLRVTKNISFALCNMKTPDRKVRYGQQILENNEQLLSTDDKKGLFIYY